MKLNPRTLSIAAICFGCLWLNDLGAEIQKVVITWKSAFCQQSCADGLAREFRKVNGVAEIDMNAAAGRMELRWKPNAGFQFQPINNAMAMIGVSIKDIRVTVRGTLTHDNRRVTLVSLGDNTRFDIINPVIPSPNQQADEFNASTRGLTDANLTKLLDAEKEHMIATIDGPLFQPERSPPILLVLESLKLDKPEKKK